MNTILTYQIGRALMLDRLNRKLNAPKKGSVMYRWIALLHNTVDGANYYSMPFASREDAVAWAEVVVAGELHPITPARVSDDTDEAGDEEGVYVWTPKSNLVVHIFRQSLVRHEVV